MDQALNDLAELKYLVTNIQNQLIELKDTLEDVWCQIEVNKLFDIQTGIDNELWSRYQVVISKVETTLNSGKEYQNFDIGSDPDTLEYVQKWADDAAYGETDFG